MCPVCLATGAVIAGSVATTGGLAALVFRSVTAASAAKNICTITPANIIPKKEDYHG